MKRMILLFLVLLLLTGCGVAETFETVTDEPVCEVLAQPREIHFFLAEESVLPVMETEGRKLYLCGEYDVMSQILEGGDLDRTIRQVSGFSPEDLTVIVLPEAMYKQNRSFIIKYCCDHISLPLFFPNVLFCILIPCFLV